MKNEDLKLKLLLKLSKRDIRPVEPSLLAKVPMSALESVLRDCMEIKDA